MSITKGPTQICECGEGFHFLANLAAHKTACERAKARAANPLKLMISGAERHISEAIRVGAGAGKEYAIAAHRMLTHVLKMIDEGKL